MDAFWEHKSLSEMNEKEWEAICDGCAKCCLHKFIDDDVDTPQTTAELREGEQLIFSKIVCDLLNLKTCSCSQYSQRTQLVPECVQLTKDNLETVFYMPNSCSYRRLHEGRGLPSWHPLLNKGKKAKMHKAGMSVRGKVIPESQVDPEDFEQYFVEWPDDDVD